MVVTNTDTPFQKGFLMGVETYMRRETILAPNYIRDDKEALEQFNEGVATGYALGRLIRV